LANSPQARKRARQNDKRRVHNHSMRARMRTGIKRFLKAVNAGDKETAQSAYREAVSVIDRTSRRGLEHPNKGSRLKSRLNNRLRAMA
jgi:small subunit ribosomal protein S20